ncbi:MAG: DUF4340 domain-containing protein [Acidiferrobacterales bacterium]|nr:DUF4340 domain-containing protein [Acidiferrobacterales bacterium]
MHSTRALTILAVATVLVALTAIVARQQTTSIPTQDEKLFPELLTQLNETAEIIGTSNEGTFTLLANEGRWLIKERRGYPADANKVHQLLIGLSQLRRVEPKTRNPELYAKIGVEDVTVEGAKSLRITLKSTDGRVLADLLLGNRRLGKANLNLHEYFVRLAGEPQSWLVEGKIPDEKSVLSWLDQRVLDLNADRVREVQVVHPDGHKVVVRRKDPSVADYELVGLPKGAEIESAYAVNSIGNTLTNLTLDDVKPAADVSFDGKGPLTAELSTFDGLRVNMQAIKDGDRSLARFRATFDSSLIQETKTGTEEKADKTSPLKQAEAVKQEADELNKRWKEWVYIIPRYRIDSLAKKKSDLLKVSEGKDKPGQSGG